MDVGGETSGSYGSSAETGGTFRAILAVLERIEGHLEQVSDKLDGLSEVVGEVSAARTDVMLLDSTVSGIASNISLLSPNV